MKLGRVINSMFLRKNLVSKIFELTRVLTLASSVGRIICTFKEMSCADFGLRYVQIFYGGTIEGNTTELPFSKAGRAKRAQRA